MGTETSEVSPETVVVSSTAGASPAGTVTIIDKRPNLSESLAMIDRTKIVGGIAIPEGMIGEAVEGLDMIGGMVKPLRIRVVQAMSKELKALGFAEGDVVVTPINVKIGDRANPFNAICLLSWADYLCLNPRNCGLFWIRSQSSDPRSIEAQKARKFAKEPLPEGGKDPKGQPWMIEYVKACNAIFWLPEHNIAAIATWMKGECKYGEALASLLMARGVSIYNSMYQVSCCERTNARSEKWDGLTVGNSPSNNGWTPENLREPMAGMHRYYRDLWSAQNLDAGYDEMTEPQESKVDTSEY